MSSDTVKIPELKEYKQLTKDTLTKLPDSEVEWAVQSCVINKIGKDYAHEHEIVSCLSKGMQMVYSTMVLEGEVFNGGFHQYYFNTEGEFAVDAIDGYQLINAPKHAEITAKSIDLASKEKELRAQIRQTSDLNSCLKAFSGSYKQTKLSDLDDAFYDLDKTEDVSKFRVQYIRGHQDEFISE